MLSLLSHLFSALAPLWEMSLTGAYVAVVVLLLRLALRNRAPRQAVCLLWLIVFARLLLPISLESPFSAVPQALTDVPASQTMGLDDTTSQGQPAGTGEDTTVPPESVSNAPSGGPITQPVNPGTAIQNPGQTVQTPNQTAASFPWQALVSGVWLAGVLAMAGYALISYLLLRRRLFDAVRASDGAWEHPGLSTPFLLGVVRPRIYLPAHLPSKARFFVLAHERTHLRRLDHIIKPVCWLALSLHWFNPAAWLAFFLLSRDLEVACDQSVVRRLGSQVKADYSAALLSVAAPRRFPTPCPLAFGGNNAKERIQSVLNYKKPTLWILVVVVIAVISAAVCLLTDPMAEQPGPDATDSASPSASPSLEPATTLPPGAELLFENQSDGLALYRQSRTPFTTYLVAGDSVQELPYSVGNTVTDLRLADLDGDGAEELAITSLSVAAAGYQGNLLVLEQVDGQWDGNGMHRLAEFSSLNDLLDDAAFTHELGNPNVTMTLSGLELTFAVSQEAAQHQGTYVVSASGGTRFLFWWGDVPYLRMTRYIDKWSDPGDWNTSYAAGGPVEVLFRLSYASDGTFSQSPVALYPGYDPLSRQPGDIIYREEFPSLESRQPGGAYHEDAMTLLSFLPEAGAYLYVTPNGQRILRSGAYIGPVPEELYPVSQSGFDINLTPLGASPGHPVLTISSVLAGIHNTASLNWSQEDGGWTVGSYTQDTLDLTTPVTADTLPEDPTRYYLVASLPEENIRLYARNQGAETVVVWENWSRSVSRRLHVMPYTPPLLNYTGGSSTQLGDLWVIAQQSLSARGDDIQELVVYRLDFEVFGQDYAYDWRTCEEAADFFSHHTLTYHASSNTFTLSYDGQDYPTGQMSDPRGDIVLEEGRTTALSPDTAFVNYAFNEDGSAAVTLQARPLDEEVDGEFFWHPFYEVSWDITFADGQFHTVPGTFTVSPLY